MFDSAVLLFVAVVSATKQFRKTAQQFRVQEATLKDADPEWKAIYFSQQTKKQKGSRKPSAGDDSVCFCYSYPRCRQPTVLVSERSLSLSFNRLPLLVVPTSLILIGRSRTPVAGAARVGDRQPT